MTRPPMTTADLLGTLGRIDELLDGVCEHRPDAPDADCYCCEARKAAQAALFGTPLDDDPMRAHAADVWAMLQTLVAALDDASSVVDAGEDEAYAYQAELESARALIQQIGPTLLTHPLTGQLFENVGTSGAPNWQKQSAAEEDANLHFDEGAEGEHAAATLHPAAPPTDEGATVRVSVERLALLTQVAEDAMGFMSCNCSYDSGTAPEDRCDGSCTHGMAKRALALAAEPTEDRWAGQSPAFRAEHPWCGWVIAFAADSDWDTTAFGLQGLVGINVLLTTADGRSRPVRMTAWHQPIDRAPRAVRAGIVIRELHPADYEPLPEGVEELIVYEDIREVVVF